MAVPNFLRVGLDHFNGEDAGEIRLDGKPLPGFLQRMTIRGKLKTDRASVLFGSEKEQPLGFQAAVIHIELALPSDGGFLGPALGGAVSTSYDKLAALQGVFAEVDTDVNAKLHRITNAHVNARGIREVWFTELSSEEGHNDVITARITLTQKEPPDFKQLRGQQAQAAGVDVGIALPDLDFPT